MFARRLHIICVAPDGAERPCPLRGLDSFAMRNFTNDAVFDDTLPVADGLLEAGHRVPLDRLHVSLADWLGRKGYLAAAETLRIIESPYAP